MTTMIQKIFSLTVIAIISMVSKAQICNPDTSLKVNGIVPSNLPHAKVNSMYDQTITVRLFRDTTAKFGAATIPVKIDSMLVIKILGMPQGLNYSCLTNNCRFLPLINTCVKISGVSSVVDSFPLKIVVRTYGKSGNFSLPPQTDTIKQFSIVVDGNAGIKYVKSNELDISPNPISSFCVLPLLINVEGPVVLDFLGKKVNVPYVYEGNDVILRTENLSPGSYFIHYGSRTAKIIKE